MLPLNKRLQRRGLFPRIANLPKRLDRLGLEPQQCVFVDDLPRNVRAAVELGFVGVRHTSYEETVGELEVLFGRRLRHESA